ncbi:MAG TPA: ATP-binding protein [Gammaproteobacteria bacterium]|nr:ATP-binding protein [Gammaproteobacteria bacterium]
MLASYSRDDRSALLPGSSDMHVLVHRHDWSRTPLGPIERWPHCLKVAVATCLDAGFPHYVLWGPDLIQIYNDAATAILRDRHPAALGQSARECWADIWLTIGPIMDKVLTTGIAERQDNIERMLNRGGGRERAWFESCYSPLRDESGNVAGIIVTTIETTDRVNAEAALRQSEATLQTAIDAAELGVWDLDLTTGRSDKHTLRHDRMFGYSEPQPEWSWRAAEWHLLDDDKPIFREAVARARRTGVLSFEARVRWPDGSIHWIAPLGRIVYNDAGEAVRVAGVVSDVTERKEAERALEAGSRAKDEFLAMLGHELRNPLQPIINTLQLMQLRQPDALADERAIVESQVRHLAEMVDDLLDVSRIARGKVELKKAPLDIGDIIARAIETAQPMLQDHDQKVFTAIEDGLTVNGDRRRLIQVITNLLTNSAKYSHTGRDIHISSGTERDQVVIRVRDQGIGIDSRLLPNVFDSFTQDPQSIERSRGGLGLGLSIVRNLVGLHGGSVEAHSEGRDQGSEFIVRLPLLERRRMTDRRRIDPIAETRPAPVGNSTRVLIVDDYVNAAESLAALLQDDGFETRVAHDGASAIEAAAEFRPAVALIDIGLPVMDGYEVARRLRAMPELKGTRLVAATGYGQEADRQHSREAGFDEHLVKPLDPKGVGTLIQELAAAHHS